MTVMTIPMAIGRALGLAVLVLAIAMPVLADSPTVAPNGQFKGPDFPPLRVVRTTDTEVATRLGLEIATQTSGPNPSGRFGTGLRFSAQDGAGVFYPLFELLGEMDSVKTRGSLLFAVKRDGTVYEVGRLDSLGRLSLYTPTGCCGALPYAATRDFEINRANAAVRLGDGTLGVVLNVHTGQNTVGFSSDTPGTEVIFGVGADEIFRGTATGLRLRKALRWDNGWEMKPCGASMCLYRADGTLSQQFN